MVKTNAEANMETKIGGTHEHIYISMCIYLYIRMHLCTYLMLNL